MLAPPRHQTPRSPSYSPSRSRSPHHRVERSKPQSRSHTSDSSASTLSNSSSTESESDSEHLGGDSNRQEQHRSSSPDVVFLGGAKDDNSEEDNTIQILDILNSDTEEVHTDVVHKNACWSDAVYTSWRNVQIHQGHFKIEQRDKTVCDHPLPGKRCEAPNQVGPPISYMKERWGF